MTSTASEHSRGRTTRVADMTQASDVINKFFRTEYKDGTLQYVHYLMYDLIRTSRFSDKKITINREFKVGCTFPIKGRSFLFCGPWFLKNFDDPDQKNTEITEQEWKRVVIRNAIAFGYIDSNEHDFYEAIEHIK